MNDSISGMAPVKKKKFNKMREKKATTKANMTWRDQSRSPPPGKRNFRIRIFSSFISFSEIFLFRVKPLLYNQSKKIIDYFSGEKSFAERT